MDSRSERLDSSSTTSTRIAPPSGRRKPRSSIAPSGRAFSAVAMVAIVIVEAVARMGGSCAFPVEPRSPGIRLHFRHPRSRRRRWDPRRSTVGRSRRPRCWPTSRRTTAPTGGRSYGRGHATLVRGPTLALAAELEAEFGPVRVFRPHSTRRFRPDAPPLRTDTGGVATSPGGCGLAVVLSPDALTVTVGHWRFDAGQRRRYRAAVDGVESGETLVGLLRRLAASGLPADPEGELQILPRGWEPDHPR